MGLPHQLLFVLPTLDLITTIGSALYLGILPLQLKSQPTWFNALFHATPSPRKYLVVILAVCLARCFTILSISSSTAKTVERVRQSGRGEDFSERALAYSVVCIISMLVNLSMLNALFQTHSFGTGKIDTSVKGIILQLNASSLAAEQLILSAVEWILFVLFVGTNKWLRPSGNAGRASNTGAAGNELPPPIEGASPVADAKSPKKDYGALSETPQPSTATDGAATSEQASAPANASQAVPESTTDSHHNADTTSSDSRPDASTSEQQTLTGGDATPSDIVDVPADRQKGQQDAKDRLQRARENGKTRRRSLWKKIRGKKDNVSESAE